MGKFKDKHGYTRLSTVKLAEGQDSTDVVAGIAGAYGAVGQISNNLKSANTMDERGNPLGEVNGMSNTLAGAGAGAKLGSVLGPKGAVIGAAVGGLYGGVSSLFADTPSTDDMTFKENQFQMGKHVGSMLPEDAFAKQQLMAKDGMDVQGGNKEIEVERDEIVLRKRGKSFVKVADFKGAKTHEQGGVDYEAKKGDVIMPGKHRNKVNSMLRNRKWGAIESLRLTLPKDTGQESFADGTKGVKTKKKFSYADMLRDVSKNKGIKSEDFLEYQEIVRYLESKGDYSAVQQPRKGFTKAPGRGAYQYETDSDGGSGSGTTAINRTKKWMNDNNYEIPEGLNSDFSQMSEELQNASDLANFRYGPKGDFDKIKNKDYKSLYLDHHWAGPKEELAKKGSYYDDSVSYMNKNKKTVAPVETEKAPVQTGGPLANIKSEETKKNPLLDNEYLQPQKYREGTSGIETDPKKSKKSAEKNKASYHRTSKHKKAVKRKNTTKATVHRTAATYDDYGVSGTLAPHFEDENKFAQVYIDQDANIVWVNHPDDKDNHVKGDNSGNFGIEVVGKVVDGVYQPATPDQLEALKKVSSFAMDRYGISIDDFDSHSELAGGDGARVSEGVVLLKSLKDAFIDEPFVKGSEMAVFDGDNKDLKFVKKYKNLPGVTVAESSVKLSEATLQGTNDVPYTFSTTTPDSPAPAVEPTKEVIEQQEAITKKEKLPVITEVDGGVDGGVNDQGVEVNAVEDEGVDEEEDKSVGPDFSGATGSRNLDEAIAAEEDAGFFTLESPTGYRAYLKDNLTREGFSGSDAELSIKSLFNQLETPELAELINDELLQKEGGSLKTSLVASSSSMSGVGPQSAFQTMFAKSFGEVVDSNLLTTVRNTTKAFLNSAYDTSFELENPTEEEKKTMPKWGSYSGFTDSPNGIKLRKEVEKLGDFMYSSNNKQVGSTDRRLGQVFNAVDNVRKLFIFGESEDGVYGDNIYNILNDLNAEEVGKFLDSSKASPEASGYILDLMTNPERHKSVGEVGVKELDAISLASSIGGIGVLLTRKAPALFKKYRSWRELSKSAEVKDLSPSKAAKFKSYYNGVKSKHLTLSGNLTAKGIKSIRKGKKWGLKLQAAKRAPNSKVAKNFKIDTKNLLDSTKKMMKNFEVDNKGNPFKDMESLDEIAKLTEELKKSGAIKTWDPKYSDIVDFFSTTYKAAKKLPAKMRDNVMRKFTDMSPKEANSTMANLEKLTGKTMAEIDKMSSAGLKSLMDNQTVKAFDDLALAQKKSKTAWADHKSLVAQEKTIQKTINETPLGSKKLDDLSEELVEVKKALVENEGIIKTVNTQKQSHWQRIYDTEEFVSTTPSHWKNSIKGEQEIARNLKGLEGLEGDLKTLVTAQKEFGKKTLEIASGAKTEISSLKSAVLKAAKDTKDKALTTARSAQGSELAANRKALYRSESAEKVPLLLKALNNHKDLVKLHKNGGITTLALYNELRKRGEPIEEIELEIIQAIESEEEDTEIVDIPEEEVIPPEGDPEVDPEGDDKDKVVPPKTDGVPPPKKPSIFEKATSTLSGIAAYAPAIYNIAKGTGTASKVERNYVNPALEQYENNSQAQLNSIDQAFDVAIGNSRNLSGGLASSFRSNVERSHADKLNRTAQVNAQETQVAVGVAGRNVGRVNEGKKINSQIDTQADQMDMRAEAARDSFLGQGISDVANITAVRNKDKAAKANQDKVYELMMKNNTRTNLDG